jgi:hypothetical protein
MKDFLRAATATIVVVLAGFSSSLTAAGQDSLRSSQLRTGNAQIIEAFRLAYAGSATFRSLVETIESSKNVVYLEAEGPGPAPFQSSLHLVHGNGPVRYWRIRLSVREPRRLVAQLAHELQHVTEVVGRPDVVDARSLSALYAQIGYRSCDWQVGECWETLQAKKIAELVVQETKTFRTAKAAAGHDEGASLQPGSGR